MADQIYAPGPEPAPLKYTVPGTQRMIPLAFQALFDGSGASGDFVPTVVIRSQAGHVIARAILGSTIAAGASAEVSWFPWGKLAASGSGTVTVTPVAYVTYNSNAFPAGTSHPTITAITSTVPGFVTAGGGGANPFTINTNGIYLFEFAVEVANANATTETVNCIVEGANQPNFLTGVVAFLSAVIPPTGAPRAATYNSPSVGVVSDAFSNVVNLRVTCSNALTVNTPVLAIAQLSTGQLA